MTSIRKFKANRANAQASTGPRTAEGKSRAAQNARRHGLSGSVLIDSSIAKGLQTTAQEIAGEDATPEIQAIALRIADAQTELVRVRRARHDLLDRYLRDPSYELRKTRKAKMKFFLHFAKGPALLAPTPDYVLNIINWKPQGPRKLADILEDLIRQLAAMDRYERRALSRRKFAIRALDALRVR